MPTRYQRIHSLLTAQYTPVYLRVEDESEQHQVAARSETHFKITLVSDHFQSCRRIQRHRSVNSLLMPEFSTGLHALSLHLFTPEEWQNSASLTPSSPSCKGGLAHEQKS
ncbi:MAG: BolA/IbaG family iron-sulfur metabolism protein [Legionellaceae bacterium]|nr:BolA/IbaG family iron-sulfur metabolism protein [Legionellaceae bacterium]